MVEFVVILALCIPRLLTTQPAVLGDFKSTRDSLRRATATIPGVEVASTLYLHFGQVAGERHQFLPLEILAMAQRQFCRVLLPYVSHLHR